LKEKEILLSILRLSKEKDSFLAEELPVLAWIPKDFVLKYLESLAERGFLGKKEGFLTISPTQKVMVLVEALNHGVPIDVACKHVSWKDFELTVKNIFEVMGYETLLRQRLKVEKKGFEVDVLAVREDLILCVDCKHWKRGLGVATLDRIVKNQIERAEAVTKNLKKISEKAGVRLKENVKILPIIVTLVEANHKVYAKVPIVPILKLKSFLENFYACLKDFKVFQHT